MASSKKKVVAKKTPTKTVATTKGRAAKGEKKAPTKRAEPLARLPKNNGVTLLSGGNPQIPKGDGDAPVQAYIAAMPDWKADVGRRLDALVTRALPKVQKAVRWNSPFYGVEGNGWFLSFHCFNKYVKVVFLRGTALTPLPPIESKDPNTRYYHVLEDGQIDEKTLTSWIKQAAKLPGEALF